MEITLTKGIITIIIDCSSGSRSISIPYFQSTVIISYYPSSLSMFQYISMTISVMHGKESHSQSLALHQSMATSHGPHSSKLSHPSLWFDCTHFHSSLGML